MDELTKTNAIGTEEFVFNQTMLRIKDPEVSLDFYVNLLNNPENREWKTFQENLIALQGSFQVDLHKNLKKPQDLWFWALFD